MGYESGLIVVDNMMEGLNRLSQGEGDAAVCPGNMAQGLIYKDGLTNLIIVDSGWPLREYCFASTDYRLLEQVDAAVLKLKKAGVTGYI